MAKGIDRKEKKKKAKKEPMKHDMKMKDMNNCKGKK